MAESLLPKLLKLAEKDDVELQCCVVKVLGELKIKNKKVSMLLAQKLSSQNHILRRYTLDALSKNPSIDGIDELLTMLEHNDSNREAVQNIVLQLGSGVVSYIKKRYTDSNESAKKGYCSILAKLYTADARNFLLDAIFDAPLDLLKHICFCLREPIEKLSVKDKQTLLKLIKVRIEKAEKNKKYSALTSYEILISFMRIAQAKTIFLKYIKTRDREMYHVRRNALIGLSKLDLKGKCDDIAKALFSVVASGDLNLVKYAADILEKIDFAVSFDKQIETFLNSKYPDVKRFGIIALGRKSNPKSLSMIVSFLNDKDYLVKQMALNSLKQIPQSVTVLIPMLDTLSLDADIQSLAYVFKEHKDKLTPERCRTMYAKLEKCLLKKDERFKVYHTIFRIAYPEYLYKTVLKKLQNLKSRKKYKEAESFSQLINRGLLFTDEVKYELAVIQLKNSSKDITVVYRNNDNSLRLFEQLLKSSDLAMVKRVKKESAFDATDLCYLGFHFAEKLFELKDFGVEVLKYCIKKYPRSKVSAKAKKKLEYAGFAVK